MGLGLAGWEDSEVPSQIKHQELIFLSAQRHRSSQTPWKFYELIDILVEEKIKKNQKTKPVFDHLKFHDFSSLVQEVKPSTGIWDFSLA